MAEDQFQERPQELTDAEKQLFRCSALTNGRVLLQNGTMVHSAAAERLRIVRAKIERANLSKHQFQIIAVSSSLPKEGKSFTAVNLARALGNDPQGRTLLIDCDLRRPSVHKFFGFQEHPGVSDVVLGDKTLSEVTRTICTGLDVVTAGTPSFDPTQTIEDPKFAEFVNSARAGYKYVILDCPPVLLCPEPITLAAIADTVIMVVRAWTTERRLFRDAVEAIGKKRVLGVVVNQGNEVSRQYGYYSYYGYRREIEDDGGNRLLEHRGTQATSEQSRGHQRSVAVKKKGIFSKLFRRTKS